MNDIALKRTVFDVVLTFGRQFLSALFKLISFLLVARILGPEASGAFAVSQLLPTTLAALIGFGIPAANVFFLSTGQYSLETVWYASRNFTLAVACIGVLLTAALIYLFSESLFPGISSALLYIALLILPGQLLLALVTGLFQAQQDFRTFNLLTLLQPVSALLLHLTAYMAGAFSLKVVLWAVAISYAITLLFGALRLYGRIRPADLETDTRYLKKAINYGYKVHIGRIATLLISRSDLFMVNLFLGPAAAGIYTVAVRLVEQLWMISQAVSVVLFPRLSALVDRETEKQKLTAIMASAILWLTLVLAILLTVVATPLVGLLFGDEFLEAALPFALMLPGVVLFSSARVMANDFAARNLVQLNLILTLGTLALNILGNLFLVPLYGVVGAAIATSFSYCCNYVARLALQQYIVGLAWWRCILPLSKSR